MKSLIIYVTLISGVFALNSCKRYLDVPPPRTSLNDELVFQDDKTADAAMAGLYSTMNGFNSSFANSNGNFYPSFSADDFRPSSSGSADEFVENSLTPSNGTVSSLWSEPYSLIYHANAVIEGVTGSKTLSAAKSTQLLGEAKFLRAFFYFYLVNYFGDVPLILNTNFLVNTSLPRTNANIVYDTIIKDLEAAQAALDNNYTSAERIRVNKGAATALLARVYLYRGQWDKAETEATKVISDPKYKLLTNVNEVFLKTSQEAIWQLQAVNTSTAGGINTWEGYSIIPVNGTTVPGYNMYPDFITSFEAGDKRAASWLTAFTPAGGGTTVYYPTKYKVRVGTPVTEYSTVMRVAEQFLIRAEARAQQSKLEDAKADVDSIRKRAGLDPLATGLTREQILLAIEKERKHELFTEWGHRWFDLRRTGRALAVLGPIKPDFTEDDFLYPIPIDAILTNPFLEQNDGYIK